jgi:small ligand-binding sensory domain FIST
MRWSSALSESSVPREAAAEATAAVRRDLAGARADLVLAFISPHHKARYAELAAQIADAFPGARVVGCSASGVIGAGREVEERAALSITAASLPGVTLTPLHLDDPLPELAADWRKRIGIPAEERPSFIILTDPFSLDSEVLVDGLDGAYPEGAKVGGLASGGRFPGENALVLDGRVLRSGALCVALTGNLTVETIVAQGCRPIGKPMVVTRAQGNVIVEIDRRKPGEVLQELYDSLDERDQTLFRHSLFVGIEMRGDQIEVKPGEYLVRNLVGMDRQTGALAIAALPRPWQVVQFLLRDARTAEDDLTQLLDRYRAGGARPDGALLFSCLGRGKHLFGAADHDTGLFRERLGPVPLGGFFCNGEIGPVGGSTFLHGYTSAFGLFRAR